MKLEIKGINYKLRKGEEVSIEKINLETEDDVSIRDILSSFMPYNHYDYKPYGYNEDDNHNRIVVYDSIYNPNDEKAYDESSHDDDKTNNRIDIIEFGSDNTEAPRELEFWKLKNGRVAMVLKSDIDKDKYYCIECSKSDSRESKNLVFKLKEYGEYNLYEFSNENTSLLGFEYFKYCLGSLNESVKQYLFRDKNYDYAGLNIPQDLIDLSNETIY